MASTYLSDLLGTNKTSFAIGPLGTRATLSSLATANRALSIPDRAGTISLSGDTFTGNVTGTLSSSGATALTIGALQVTNAMIANGTIDLTTKVTGILPAANFPAMLGEVTNTAGSLTTTVKRSTNFIWTGNHTFKLGLIAGGDGATTTTISMLGKTSGQIDIIAADAAGTWSFRLPVLVGTSGQPLLSGGTLNPCTWGSLGVLGGGTGVGTFAANGVLYGNAATSVLVTAQGAANSILTANAGAPSFSQTPICNTSFQIGVASSVTGELILAGSGGANLHKFRAAAIPAAANTYVWPSADPAASDVLTASAPAAGIVTLTWGAATIADGTVTLAKLANLAQDQFIGRITASTGVPETATITAAARTVLDDTTVGAMVNTLGGATATGTGGLVRATAPTITGLLVKGPWADVKAYGATGDGVTDDTAAVQAALDASLNVFFPTGVYVVANLTTRNTHRIFGTGTSSSLLFKTGSTGYMFENGSISVQFQDLDLDGGTNTDQSAATSAGNRSGIHVSTINPNNSIINLSVHGFSNIGIGYNGTYSLPGYPGAPKTIAVNVYYNYIGIDTGVGAGPGVETGAEYMSFSGITAFQNRVGIKVNSGNNTFADCHLDDNGYGFWINGAALNNAHGSIVGSTINHSAVYGIYCDAANTNGFSICGNQIWYSNSYFHTCTGFTVTGNTFVSSTMTLTNGGANLMRNNWFGTGNTVNRTTDNWIMSDNYHTDGTYNQSRQSVVVASTGSANSILTEGAGSPAWSQTPIVNTSLQLGVANSVTGELILAGSGGANLHKFRAAAIPAAANTYVWPSASPNASDVLTASAPAAGIVTLTWGAAGGGGAPVGATYVTLSTDATLTNERVLTPTANQVLINDGGAGTTITLSTPQNIHTGATPRFERMGLGAAATSNYGLVLQSALSGSTLQIGMVFSPIIGSTCVTAIGTYGAVETSAASFTVTTASGVRAVDATLGAGSAITTLNGFECTVLTKGATNRGFSSQVASTAADPWNFHGSGSAPSYFNHNCLIGTTTISTGATFNISLGGGSSTPVIGAQTADIVSLAAVDFAAGDRRFTIMPEAGAGFYLGSSTFQLIPKTGTNTAGVNLTFTPSAGTGTGANAKVMITADAAGTASGTTVHTQVNRVILNGSVALTSNVASTILTVPLATLQMAGGTLLYTVECTDGTDMLAYSGNVTFSAVNKAGTYTTAIGMVGVEQAAKSSGIQSLTNTWSISTGTNQVLVQLTSIVSGNTPTTFRVTTNFVSGSQQNITAT